MLVYQSAFNSNGNKGIACGLGNIQKIRDGEPLGGRSNAADDFTSLEDDDFLAQEVIMTLIDWFIAIFIGTWLLDFVVKTMVSLYLDIRGKINRKQ